MSTYGKVIESLDNILCSSKSLRWLVLGDKSSVARVLFKNETTSEKYQKNEGQLDTSCVTFELRIYFHSIYDPAENLRFAIDICLSPALQSFDLNIPHALFSLLARKILE